MKRTLGAIAERLGGEVRGDPARVVRRVCTLRDAGPDDLSFLTGARYLDEALASDAGALLVGADAVDRLGGDLVVVEEPHVALAELLELFAPARSSEPGIDATAVIAESAIISPSATVGPLCVIGERSVVGDGAVLGAHVVLGEDCSVGTESRLHARVTLYAHSVVGARCILHSGVVIGADGYGFATSGGRHRKLRHLGRAVLEDDVEIGANSAVDRGLLGDTRIGAGTKIDDLVMVGHNVQVGRDCLLVAQVGLAGSARLGDRVTVAGQSGIIGHVEIGDDVVVATKSAVLQPVERGRQVAGIPATDLSKWRRQQALVGRLGDLRSRLLGLERAAKRKVAGKEPAVGDEAGEEEE